MKFHVMMNELSISQRRVFVSMGSNDGLTCVTGEQGGEISQGTTGVSEITMDILVPRILKVLVCRFSSGIYRKTNMGSAYKRCF
jgi:hypothetical protein